jgi:hypothetical protein
MPFFRQRDARFWISKLPGAFNAFQETGTEYLLARIGSPFVLLPTQEKENDAGQAGNGHPYATFQCNRYWLPMSAQIDAQADFDLLGRLWLRALGGDVVDSVVSAGAAWKHAANQKPIAEGLDLDSFNAISELGGVSSIHAGVVMDSFQMSQDAGAAIPRVAAGMLSSGKHRGPHQIGTRQVETATAAGTATGNGNVNVTITAVGLPGSPLTVVVAILTGETAAQWADKVRIALAAHPVVKYFFAVSGATTAIILTKRHTAANDTTFNIALANGTPSPGITPAATSAETTAGAFTLPTTPSFVQCPLSKVEVKWTDPDGLRDFATASGCPLRSWVVGLNNNHAPADDRCSTDPQQIENDPTTTTGAGAASYLTKLSIGDPTVTSQIVILMDSIVPEFPKYAQNMVLTDVTFSILGPDLAPTFPAKITAIIPQARIQNIAEVDSNGKAALQIDLLPIYDSTSGGAIKGEVINGLDGASPDYN